MLKTHPKGLTLVQLLLEYTLLILTDIHQHLICARYSELPNTLSQRKLQDIETEKSSTNSFTVSLN